MQTSQSRENSACEDAFKTEQGPQEEEAESHPAGISVPTYQHTVSVCVCGGGGGGGLRAEEGGEESGLVVGCLILIC